MKQVYETYSAEETYRLGQKFGERAQPGQIYTLTGDLGTGKTVFTQGFAAGMGIRESVNSPRLQFCRNTKRGVCLFIILMYTGSAMRRKWKR